MCEHYFSKLSPVGTAENSPGRQSWVGLSTAISPEGTTENDPGRQSWVHWKHTGMRWQSPKANPILSETTDCIQSTDYPVQTRFTR